MIGRVPNPFCINLAVPNPFLINLASSCFLQMVVGPPLRLHFFLVFWALPGVVDDSLITSLEKVVVVALLAHEEKASFFNGVLSLCSLSLSPPLAAAWRSRHVMRSELFWV